MKKGKRMKRSLDSIGKRWHEFDINLERNIYSYVCCAKMNRIKAWRLDKNLKFDTYQQWKNYIVNKYENVDKDMLIEFSRYLNQNVRNLKPTYEYWVIAATVVLTWALTKVIDIFFGAQMDYEGIYAFVAAFIFEIFVAIFLIFVVFQTMKPLFDSNLDENFLRDYKEIIDDLIAKNNIVKD